MIKDIYSKQENAQNDATDVRTMLMLAVATSIDALAVGISFACVGINSWGQLCSPILIITLVSCVLALLGYALGVAFGKRIQIPVEPLGGVILVVIGCKILYEHLML